MIEITLRPFNRMIRKMKSKSQNLKLSIKFTYLFGMSISFWLRTFRSLSISGRLCHMSRIPTPTEKLLLLCLIIKP